MKLSIKSIVLQEMVSKSIKGASQNKLIPLTSLMAIQLKDKQLTLTTTDASNYLYIVQDNVEGDDFYVVVYADQFSKLISKITSENVSLELEDKILSVKANGTYKIELPLDENGELIQYPDPVAETTMTGEVKIINLATVKTILNVNKASLAMTMEEPAYTGYYVGDKVVTTDTYKICGLNSKLFDEPVLISPDLMNLLDVVTDEKIEVYMQDDILKFVTKNCIIFGHKMEGIENFAIEAISTLIDEKFKSTCKINKADILAALDRISLFVGAYDNKAITLTFTQDGIDISSKQSNGIETIGYVESKKFKAYTCILDITMLVDQIKANESDTIEIQYGNEQSIKIVNDNVIQVIALLNDEAATE